MTASTCLVTILQLRQDKLKFIFAFMNIMSFSFTPGYWLIL